MAVKRFDKKPKSWGEDEKKVAELMFAHIKNQKDQPTSDLLPRSCTKFSQYSSVEFDLLELGQEQCLPSGWERCLNLQTGQVYYMNSEGTELISKVSSSQKISRVVSVGEEEKIDLKLKLSTSDYLKSGRKYSVDIRNTDNNNIAEEVESSMKLVGCPQCLMYFMVATLDLKCPRCKGSLLLDF